MPRGDVDGALGIGRPAIAGERAPPVLDDLHQIGRIGHQGDAQRALAPTVEDPRGRRPLAGGAPPAKARANEFQSPGRLNGKWSPENRPGGDGNVDEGRIRCERRAPRRARIDNRGRASQGLERRRSPVPPNEKRAQPRFGAEPFSDLARPERFELPTTWFVARYSIQLSYGRLKKRVAPSLEALSSHACLRTD